MLKNRIAKYAAIALVGVATLAGVAIKKWDDYTSTPRYVVNNTLTNIGQPKNPLTIEDYREEYPITKKEAQEDLERILSNAPFQRTDVKKVELAKSVTMDYLQTENRRGLKRQIELIGRDSVNHLFSFINSPYITSSRCKITK
jgi:hypothetical protein